MYGQSPFVSGLTIKRIAFTGLRSLSSRINRRSFLISAIVTFLGIRAIDEGLRDRSVVSFTRYGYGGDPIAYPGSDINFVSPRGSFEKGAEGKFQGYGVYGYGGVLSGT